MRVGFFAKEACLSCIPVRLYQDNGKKKVKINLPETWLLFNWISTTKKSKSGTTAILILQHLFWLRDPFLAISISKLNFPKKKENRYSISWTFYGAKALVFNDPKWGNGILSLKSLQFEQKGTSQKGNKRKGWNSDKMGLLKKKLAFWKRRRLTENIRISQKLSWEKLFLFVVGWRDKNFFNIHSVTNVSHNDWNKLFVKLKTSFKFSNNEE